jgi:hypothetical protein
LLEVCKIIFFFSYLLKEGRQTVGYAVHHCVPLLTIILDGACFHLQQTGSHVSVFFLCFTALYTASGIS